MALGREPDSELELHDAYSRAVIGVVDRIGPSVVSLRVKTGARRSAVGQGSPAAEAGFRDGDILLELDGHALPTALTLQRTLRGMKPDVPVEANIARGSELLKLSVKPREP